MKGIVALAACAVLGSLLAAAAFAVKHTSDQPNPPAPAVMIVTRLAGAAASATETSVTDPIERAILRAAGVAHVESRSLRGLSIVKIDFRQDISTASAVAVTDAVVHHITPELPTGASPLVMPVDFDADSPLGFVAWRNTPAEPSDFAHAHANLRARLGSLSGAGPWAVEGESKRVTFVRYDRIKLQARNASLLPLAQALKKETGTALTSKTTVGGVEYGLRSTRERGSDLLAIPLPGSRGSTYVRDVADVRQAVASGPSVNHVDGQASAIMPVYAKAGAEPETLLVAVQRELRGGARLCAMPAAGDDGLIRLRIRLASGATLNQTEVRVGEMENAIRKQIHKDDTAFVLSRIGVGDDWPAAFSENASSSDATIDVRLAGKAAGEAKRYAASLRAYFEEDERFSSVDMIVMTADTAALDVQVFADSLEDGRTLAEQVRQRLGADRALQARIIERLDAPAYELDIDLRKAADLGITGAEVKAQLALATGGQGSSWSAPDLGSSVRMELSHSFDRITDLLNLPVGGERQNLSVRLGDVAQLTATVEPVEIDHVGLQRVTRVRVYHEQGDRERAVKAVKKTIAELPNSPGVRVDLAE